MSLLPVMTTKNVSRRSQISLGRHNYPQLRTTGLKENRWLLRKGKQFVFCVLCFSFSYWILIGKHLLTAAILWPQRCYRWWNGKMEITWHPGNIVRLNPWSWPYLWPSGFAVKWDNAIPDHLSKSFCCLQLKDSQLQWPNFISFCLSSRKGVS